MCGRLAQKGRGNLYSHLFTPDPARVADILERDRTVPGQELLVCLTNARGVRELRGLIWGIDGHSGLIYNARCETVAEKPTFRDFWQRRCLVPVELFEEGGGTFGAGDRTLALGGIFTAVGRVVIITRPASREIERYHKRMPLIVPRDRWDPWLDRGYPHPDTLLADGPAPDGIRTLAAA